MVSIIIPARNEKFLQKTIDCLIEKARGDYEILVGLDGYWPIPNIKDHPKVTLYHVSKAIGMRRMINSLVRISKGDFIMKIDAHCNISKGFDKKLSSVCKDNMICIPRQFSLHAETWLPNKKKRFTDYWYLDAPTIHLPEEKRGSRNRGLVAHRWKGMHNEKLIDDIMCFQGSLWFMTRKLFDNIGLSCKHEALSYESTELALKTWLSGGRVVVVKKVWYAHLYKGKKYPRQFKIIKSRTYKTAEDCIKTFMGGKWPKAIHDMKWLIDKFGPVPTWENFNWSHEW